MGIGGTRQVDGGLPVDGQEPCKTAPRRPPSSLCVAGAAWEVRDGGSPPPSGCAEEGYGVAPGRPPACTSRLPRPPMPVTLNVYNLGKSRQMEAVNKFLRHLEAGAVHCGVEVFGVEWSYFNVPCRSGEKAVGTGIFSTQPRRCEGHSFVESIPMGSTRFSEADVDALLRVMRRQWPAEEYSMLRRNCCHFSNVFCRRLGVGNIPPWIMKLTAAGAACADPCEVVCCRGLEDATQVWPSRSLFFCCGPQEPLANAVVTTGVDESDVVDIIESLPVLPGNQQRHIYNEDICLKHNILEDK